MTLIFEELDWQTTPLGDISLRKRSEPRLNNLLIYEVKLNEDFLMSSLFVEAEEQLSKISLAKLKENGHDKNLSIVVGGLGLGYTAVTALNNHNVTQLRTIDVMQPVISWHKKGILPVGNILDTDTRSELIHEDFFKVAIDTQKGFLNEKPVDAVLLDIDHSPSHWLNETNRQFYTQESLSAVAKKIKPGGIFSLWSNDAPDQDFIKLLNTVFIETDAHIINFPNPYSGGESINSVYVSTVAR